MAVPVFTTSGTFEVAENSTSVGGIVATDADLENLQTLFLDPNTQFNNDATLTGNIVLHVYRDWETDRKSTRLNSSHSRASRMPSSA